MLLLDTNVVSELRKVRAGKADPNAAIWADTVDEADLFISAVVIHELEISILLLERRDSRQGELFRKWLQNVVLPAFDGRILPVDCAVAVRAAGPHVPDPRPINDAFIAATALVHGMTLVTRHISDFREAGVPLLNPWTTL